MSPTRRRALRHRQRWCGAAVLWLALVVPLLSALACAGCSFGGAGGAGSPAAVDSAEAGGGGGEAVGAGGENPGQAEPGSSEGPSDPPQAARRPAARRSVRSGPVELLVPPQPAAGSGLDPDALAATLGQAVTAMADRVPVRLGTPLTVALEESHVSQIRRAGAVGEAVAGGSADVHLVHHPDDLFAYRHALAMALLRRAGLAAELPPYLLRGAALWLSGDWYGRPWAEWPPVLAAAGVLPSEAELTAAEEPPDGSRLLWTPVAAAVVDRLPGDTLRARLAALRDGEQVGELLAAVAAEAAAEPAAGPGGAVSVPRDPVPSFLAGVSLAMLNHVELGYHAPSVDRALERLRTEAGADAVSLMPFAYQRGAATPALVYLNRSPRSETDMAMIHAARRAQDAGFAVLWKPQIWLSGAWPGDIAMDGDDDWAAWWRSYHRFVVHQAVLARWCGAELFSVGVELGRTLEREEEWRRLIGAVRTVYDGPLTYAANWHGDFGRVPFWDALDYLGMDAYRSLADSPDAGPEALRRGAREAVEQMRREALRLDKELVLTEVGFSARRGAWVHPHDEGGDYSEADQARAYAALFEVLGRPDWLRGVFVWKAFSSGNGRGDEGQSDFRFLDRRAEEVVREYLGGR